MNTYTQMFVTETFFLQKYFRNFARRILDFISHTQTNEV